MGDDVSNRRIEIVTSLHQVQRKEFPITYLGCPIFSGRKKVQYFIDMATKILKRLSAWYCNMLSKGRKVILIKHVLTTMPVHLLSICQPPKTILKQIEKIFANFLWGSKDGKQKYHQVAWHRLCFPTEECGIGISSLQDISDRFSAKLW